MVDELIHNRLNSMMIQKCNDENTKKKKKLKNLSAARGRGVKGEGHSKVSGR